MEISSVIKTLLYHHNCVIIPGFGGLVAEYASAEIHPVQHIFLPPHKTLAFNRNLNSNDGLLIADLARSENISYEESTLRIQQYVRQIENALRTKGAFLLPGIGKFYFDVEKNLQFKEEEHQNFLLPAFGLDRFIANPVLRRDEVIASVKQTVVLPQKKRRLRALSYGIALAVLVLAAQVFTVNTDFRSLHFQQTGLYKFFNSVFTTSNNSTVTSERNNRYPDKDTLINIFIIQPDTAPARDIAALNNTIQNSFTSTTLNTETGSPAGLTQPAVTAGEYYVIFGCFKGEENSLILINQLKVKGVTARIVINDSYRRVGIGGFRTKEDAVQQMQTYHQQGFADAWVMKK